MKKRPAFAGLGHRERGQAAPIDHVRVIVAFSTLLSMSRLSAR